MLHMTLFHNLAQTSQCDMVAERFGYFPPSPGVLECYLRIWKSQRVAKSVLCHFWGQRPLGPPWTHWLLVGDVP
jgi:hypothetical protein